MSQSKNFARIPRADEIQELPRRARIAFAARCARRVLPLFRAYWPSAPGKYMQAVGRAIVEAEASASHRRIPSDRVAGAIAEDAEDAANHIAESGVGSTDATQAAHNAALAAANAAKAVFCFSNSYPLFESDTQHVAVAAAAEYAVGAAKAARVSVVFVANAICSDLRLLKTFVTREGCDDIAQIPPDVFGPMWPDGEPAGWPKPEETPGTDDERENIFDDVEPLTLAIDPGSATPEEIAELLAEISKLYRMVGGSGINFRLADVWSLEGAVA